jgi:sodium-dependent dicarboxylate transporter 2/3/5
LRINPIYLMLPVTLCCSYAFMLPVATPPNAIVYSASGMKTSEMVRRIETHFFAAKSLPDCALV